MDVLLTQLETIIPTFLAIMSVVMFKPKTRWLSYSIVILAIIAELIPFTVNVTALLATITCFFGLLFAEYLNSHHIENKEVFSHKH